MTNTAAAMRMLITYAICIPAAILVGYLLTNPLDYGTLGFIAFIIAILISPVFIKWHYPMLFFGLACPAVCFFLPGKPPLWQVMVIISLGIAVVERTMSREKLFISPAVMVWPLLFIAAMAYMTAELNGGVQLHAAGGDVGGGRKYITLFCGVAVFFAMTSQVIPPHRRNFYFGLYFLTGLSGLIGNLFPFLPHPLTAINLLFPPTMSLETEITESTRFTALSFSVGSIIVFLLAKYGLGGIISPQRPWRALIFFAAILASLLGGFRSSLAGLIMNLVLLFFLEGLHRTRLAMVVVLFVGLLGTVVVVCSDSLPYTFQRSLSFLPLKWRADVVLDATGSSEWRYKIWRDTWPKVPEHLLLGKGYVLTKEDYDMIGQGTFAMLQASHIDASEESLAISGDYHSGPLSALMPFGLWGGIGIVWLMGATGFVLYRNCKYGDPELKPLNNFLLVTGISSFIAFYFIFGSFNDAIGEYAKLAGLSIAMNGGLGRSMVKERVNQLIKPRPVPLPESTLPIAHRQIPI